MKGFNLLYKITFRCSFTVYVLGSSKTVGDIKGFRGQSKLSFFAENVQRLMKDKVTDNSSNSNFLNFYLLNLIWELLMLDAHYPNTLNLISTLGTLI